MTVEAAFYTPPVGSRVYYVTVGSRVYYVTVGMILPDIITPRLGPKRRCILLLWS